MLSKAFENWDPTPKRSHKSFGGVASTQSIAWNLIRMKHIMGEWDEKVEVCDELEIWITIFCLFTRRLNKLYECKKQKATTMEVKL